MGFKPLPAAIAVAIALLIWFVIPVPEGVTPNAWHLLALFVGTIAAIIGKAMPIGALSMIAVALVAVTGVTNDKPAGAIADALSSFSHSLIWLIGVSIMISRGIIKTGLGARIGYLFIALWGKKTIGIAYSLALSELILAPVTPSNTARGGGIIHPIMRAIAGSYDSDPEKGTQGRIGRYLALTNYHANPITSAMFITATAPNPLVVKLIADVTGAQIQLSWGTWALAMLLPGLVALAVMPLVGFDARCQRLGMGGGWYDRSFAFLKERRRGRAAPPWLVGAGFAVQRVPMLEPAEWDIVPDAICTEESTLLRENAPA